MCDAEGSSLQEFSLAKRGAKLKGSPYRLPHVHESKPSVILSCLTLTPLGFPYTEPYASLPSSDLSFYFSLPLKNPPSALVDVPPSPPAQPGPQYPLSLCILAWAGRDSSQQQCLLIRKILLCSCSAQFPPKAIGSPWKSSPNGCSAYRCPQR